MLGFNKRKSVTPACAWQGSMEGREAAEPDVDGVQAAGAADGMVSIAMPGSGCKSCHALLENTRAAAEFMGISAAVEYVTDLETVMALGVMSLPALIVNGKVVSAGKVLKAAEVEKCCAGRDCNPEGTETGSVAEAFWRRV